MPFVNYPKCPICGKRHAPHSSKSLERLDVMQKALKTIVDTCVEHKLTYDETSKVLDAASQGLAATAIEKLIEKLLMKKPEWED